MHLLKFWRGTAATQHNTTQQSKAKRLAAYLAVILCLTAGSPTRLLAATGDGNGGDSQHNVNGGQQSSQNQQAPSANALKLSTITIGIAPSSHSALANGFSGGEGLNQIQSQASEAPKPIERIQVTGQRPDGFTWSYHFFSNMFKEQIRDALVTMIADLLRNAAKEYVEQEEVAEVVCSTIRANTPSYCTGYSWVGPHDHMPARRFDAGTWSFPTIANGCGAGGALEDLAFEVFKQNQGWTDDRNEPVAGHSFKSACDGHDVCYSAQSDKSDCDRRFRDAMATSCNGKVACDAAAGLYLAAVHGNSGSSAYIQAGKERTCRNIQHESAANSCH